MLFLILGFIAAWIVLYVFVIRPKLAEFRYTAGIYAKLDTIEAGFWAKTLLLLKGAKVAILGFVTSSAPVLAVLYDKLTDLDWTKFVADDKAKVIAAVVAMLGVIGPMVMVLMHQHAIADAAATEPQT